MKLEHEYDGAYKPYEGTITGFRDRAVYGQGRYGIEMDGKKFATWFSGRPNKVSPNPQAITEFLEEARKTGKKAKLYAVRCKCCNIYWIDWSKPFSIS